MTHVSVYHCLTCSTSQNTPGHQPEHLQHRPDHALVLVFESHIHAIGDPPGWGEDLLDFAGRIVGACNDEFDDLPAPISRFGLAYRVRGLRPLSSGDLLVISGPSLRYVRLDPAGPALMPAHQLNIIGAIADRAALLESALAQAASGQAFADQFRAAKEHARDHSDLDITEVTTFREAGDDERRGLRIFLSEGRCLLVTIQLAGTDHRETAPAQHLNRRLAHPA
jgi:hypothetical protein